MNNIVLITTIFPASKDYLDDFFTSLENQIEKNFDILVVNDGIKNFTFFKKKYSNLNLIEFKSHKSAAKNREAGINKAKEFKYEKIIWGDSDDFFPKNRILEISKLLDKHNIVVNELLLYVNEKFEKTLLGIFYKNGLYKIDDVIDKNVIGFSNLAVKSEIIPDKINFNDDLISIDLFFATTLLLNNKYFYFTNTTFSFYRQHDKNLIGANTFIDINKIMLGIKVKLAHYKNLTSHTINNSKFNKLFNKKYKEIGELKVKMLESGFAEIYKSTIKNKTNQPFIGWWSEIISINQMNKHEN